MRRASTAWFGASVALALVALVGCTADKGGEVASAGRGGATTARPSSTPATDSALEQERRFVACMRENGIADMVDPIPGDTSGRSAVRYMLDVKGQGSNPAFQAALDKCKDLLPAVPRDIPTVDIVALRAFAQCMRENGIPDFPDPNPGEFTEVGSTAAPPATARDGRKLAGITVGTGVGAGNAGYMLRIGDPRLRAAFDKCKSTYAPAASAAANLSD